MRSDPKQSPATPFLDILFNMVLLFVALFVISFLQMQLKKSDAKIKVKADFMVTMEWPTNHKYDVDLYVQNPLGQICFFKSREVGLMHLDRDDLGQSNDKVTLPNGKTIDFPENREIITLRGFVPGEYIVNAHLYSEYGGSEPVKVKIKLEKLNPYSMHEARELTLSLQDREATAFRFTVDKDGNITSTNRIPKQFTSAEGIPPNPTGGN